MTRESTAQGLGDRELDLMNALWERGEATVAEVREDLAASGVEIAYTTVQTLLNRLTDKRIVARVRSGRAFVYRPLLHRPTAAGGAVSSLLDRFFGGSAAALARHLVEHDLDPDEIERLQRLLDEADRTDREDR